MEFLFGLIIVLVILVVLFKLFFKIGGIIFGFLVNSLVGATVLWILNIFGLGIKINWLTAALVGILGVPGLVIVLVLKFVFHVV